MVDETLEDYNDTDYEVVYFILFFYFQDKRIVQNITNRLQTVIYQYTNMENVYFKMPDSMMTRTS